MKADPRCCQTVITFSLLGELAARKLGDLQRGQELALWALAVARSLYDKPHWNAAMALHNAALVAQMREEFPDALALYGTLSAVLQRDTAAVTPPLVSAQIPRGPGHAQTHSRREGPPKRGQQLEQPGGAAPDARPHG